MNDPLYIYIPHSIKAYILNIQNAELYEILKIHFGSMISDSLRSHLSTTIILEKNLVLYIDEQIINTVKPNIVGISYYILEYIRNDLQFEDEWNGLHGSAVILENKCYLLLAPTHSGKTTLVTYLTQKKNAFLVTEDLAVINYNNFCVYSIQRPLLLRPNAYDILKDDYNLIMNNTSVVKHNFEERIFVVSNHVDANTTVKIDNIVILNLNPVKQNINISSDINDIIFNSYCYTNIKKNVCSALRIIKNISIYNMNFYNFDEKLSFHSLS